VAKITGKQIHEYLKPFCGEMFENYLVVGFQADSEKLIISGNSGDPVKSPERNEILTNINLYAQEQLAELRRKRKLNAKKNP
jgi:hypothetical protein